MTSTVRKAHIKRCYGFDETSRETDDSIWVDVLRIDQISFDVRGDDAEPKDKVGKIKLPKKDPDTEVRRVTLFIKWDDSGLETEDTHRPSRKVKVMKCVDPSQPAPENVTLNPDDLYVPIKVIDSITLTEEGRDVTYIFKNRNVLDNGDRIPTSRQISTIRLFNYDTTVDDQLTKDTPIIPDFSAYQIQGDADKGDVNKQNDGGQWLDFELIRSFPYKLGGSSDGKTAQEILLTFTHKPMFDSIGIDLSQAGAPGQQNSFGDDIIAARMDPFQQIINVSWAKSDPKYAYIYGRGVIVNLMLFSVDDKSGELKIVSKVDPIHFNGFPSYLNPTIEPAPVPSPTTNECYGPRPGDEGGNAGGIGKVDWKGIIKLGGPDDWYDVLFANALQEAFQEGKAFPGTSYIDIDGVSATGFTDVPKKGLSRHGLWVQEHSVSRYNGDTLIWKRAFGYVHEVLSGGRIIAESEENKIGFGIYTISMNDGSTTKFIQIEDGGDGDKSDPFMSGWSTASDGSIFISMYFTDFAEGDGFDLNYHSVFKKYDIDGKKIWEKALPTIIGNYSAGVDEELNRSPCVVENKNGDVFLISTGMSERRVITSLPFVAYEYDSLVYVMDPENGDITRTIIWGTSWNNYDTGGPDISLRQNHGNRHEFPTFIANTPRFPAANKPT